MIELAIVAGIIGVLVLVVLFFTVLEKAKTWWAELKKAMEDEDKARQDMTKDSFDDFNRRNGIDFESKEISDEEWAAQSAQKIQNQVEEARQIHQQDKNRDPFRGFTNVESIEGVQTAKKELGEANLADSEPFPLPEGIISGPNIAKKDFYEGGQQAASAAMKRFELEQIQQRQTQPLGGFPMIVTCVKEVGIEHSGPFADPKMSVFARNSYDHNPNRYQTT